MTHAFWCERAWVDGTVRDGVLLRADETGVLTQVRVGVSWAEASAGADMQCVPGIVFPGGVNAHSHAFHRLLRGRTHADGGTFWTWRSVMYDMAGRLTPESYRVVARAVFAEMLAGGWTSVGEFHYVHHAPDGRPYGEAGAEDHGDPDVHPDVQLDVHPDAHPDVQPEGERHGSTGAHADAPHAMELALAAAAEDAGIRLRLLDTCYLTGSIGEALSAEQARFGDGDIEGFLERHAALARALASRGVSFSHAFTLQEERAPGPAGASGGPRGGGRARGTGYRIEGQAHAGGFRAGNPSLGDSVGLVSLGAAIHSVRAVPAEALARFRELDGPVHIHLSEQPAENEASLAAYGRTPTGVLDDAGVLGSRLSPVHATHLTDADIAALGAASTTIVMCPTTEADLADGIGPALELADAGATIALGSDQHVVLDALRELQALEAGERLRSGVRGRFTPVQLIDAMTTGGARSLDLPVGAFEVGRACDFIAVDPASPRTYGSVGEQVMLAGTSADVHTVVTAGRVRVRDGVHEQLGDIGELYREAYAAIGEAADGASAGSMRGVAGVGGPGITAAEGSTVGEGIAAVAGEPEVPA